MKYTDVIGDIVALKNSLNKKLKGVNFVISIQKGLIGLSVTNESTLSHRELCKIIAQVGGILLERVMKKYPDFYFRYGKSSFSRFL